MKKLTLFNLLLLLILGCLSCASSKKTLYFANQGNDDLLASNLAPKSLIQSGDILSITVNSLSQQSSNAFNISNVAGGGINNNYSYSSNQLGGYLVSADGYIKFPILGKLKVSGLTKTELEEMITAAINEKKLLIDPIISVRHLNFKVTVLGEVGHPSVINVPSERISLLEAIGMAGDLTIYGKRENVLVIREENNKKITKRLNLNSNELFGSPFYYLQPNDVVYVEPNLARVESAARGRELLPVVFSGLSFGVIVLDMILRKK